jgi:hypothetical protein
MVAQMETDAVDSAYGRGGYRPIIGPHGQSG